MCGIVVASRTLDIDPDNVATPIAAALGDLVTLLLLAATGSLLHSLPTASTVSCRGKEIRNINIVTQFLVPGHIPLLLMDYRNGLLTVAEYGVLWKVYWHERQPDYRPNHS